jgi:hypothetical protein
MIALNIRGTSGAGKSHLARRLLAHYPANVPSFAEGRRTPISALYTGAKGPPLFALGHYTAEQGGGADTVDRVNGFTWLEKAAKTKSVNLLWEGVIFSDEVPHTVELSRLIDVHVILLNTPLEQCLADIRARREARGNTKPLSESNTANRVKSLQNAFYRLRQSQTVAPGLKLYQLGREEAYEKCLDLLELKT